MMPIENLYSHSFWYAVLGLGAGTFFFAAGVLVIFFARSGKTKWKLRVGPLELDIATAVPGIVLATLGFLVIYFTRYDGGL
jgi:hypothetical protein